jgi:hypothetical protein
MVKIHTCIHDHVCEAESRETAGAQPNASDVIGCVFSIHEFSVFVQAALVEACLTLLSVDTCCEHSCEDHTCLQSIKSHAHDCSRCRPRRREALVAVTLAVGLLSRPEEARANVLEGLAKQLTRPEGIDQVSATVALMDAASVLQEIQVGLE